ncbi:hypothetical protein EUZ85_08450 [Hahella sp. KA22]|uniref:hypothetical protein n=2 Tax=Gammaproteobacteria TaxID=1236 RepID=UPI000FDCF2AB|nr:hypothetical protein [Hahella sp. KA22]AZZ90740.1 hypothetical protein ENC22_05895 [Hahella sp. KA22]QAY54111.1 hypothetical protein EUZ85_08450 [Hahella sp. KA22]
MSDKYTRRQVVSALKKTLIVFISVFSLILFFGFIIPLLLELKLSSFSWLISWSFWKVILIIVSALAALYLVGTCLNKADQFLKQRLPFKAYAAYLAFGRLMQVIMYLFLGAMLYRGYINGNAQVYGGALVIVYVVFANNYRRLVNGGDKM